MVLEGLLQRDMLVAVGINFGGRCGLLAFEDHGIHDPIQLLIIQPG